MLNKFVTEKILNELERNHSFLYQNRISTKKAYEKHIKSSRRRNHLDIFIYWVEGSSTKDYLYTPSKIDALND